MGATLEPLQLRPLGIGEIFDRAVTLYVRNFLLFTIISAFLVVPLSVVNYFITTQRAGTFAQILDQIQHPSRSPAAAAMPFGPWLLVLVAVSFLITPFMYVATASALGRIYNGEVADWRAAYGIALRHAVSIVVTAIFQVMILAAAAFVGALVLGFALIAAVLLVRAVAPLGVITIVLTVVLLIAYIVGLMLCYLAVALAFDAIGIEEAPFGRAISSSFARIFNRSEAGKAALICLAFLAVELGLTVVAGVADGLIEAFLHQPVIETIVQGLISLVTTGFIAVLLAVYYFDVRIRREGLDMQAAIDQLQAQP